VHGRCGGIWRESIAFSQFSFDSILPFLAGVQEETFVVSGGLLKPAAQRTREALRGAEIRNEAGPKAAGRHAGLDGRTGKQKVCHLPPPCSHDAVGNSLRQTFHTHCASVHQAAKLVAALLRVAGVTADLAESNCSLPPGL